MASHFLNLQARYLADAFVLCFPYPQIFESYRSMFLHDRSQVSSFLVTISSFVFYEPLPRIFSLHLRRASIQVQYAFAVFLIFCFVPFRLMEVEVPEVLVIMQQRVLFS